MLKVQLDSVEGAPVTVTVDRPILARLVREVEAAFDTRLEQARVRPLQSSERASRDLASPP